MSDETTTQDVPELSEKAQKIMELVGELSVLELADLVKAMEDKFGVSASAPVMMAGPGGAVEEEEKTTVDVILKSPGSAKIAVIKVVREITGLGLKDAKTLVDTPDSKVKEWVERADAEDMKTKLVEAGAEIELK